MNVAAKMKTSITTEPETITPALAEQWLKTKNVRNRTPNLGRVAAIAADIVAGRWVENGATIGFGADDTLYDGQHRLMAIVKAGLPVRSIVVRGLAPEARDLIDMGGANRSARDVVQITDGANVPHVHVAWVTSAEQMLRATSLVAHRVRLTAAALRSGLARHRAALLALTPALGTANERRLLPASAVGALLIAHRVLPTETLVFATRVKTGEALLAGDPALVFRNHLIAIRGTQGGGAAASDEIALRTFSAFDAFARNESLKLLKANAGARERFLAAFKAAETTERAKVLPLKGKAANEVTPSAPGKFADAIRASQLQPTKKPTPDAPPPPVAVVPPKRSSTRTLVQINAVRRFLADGKTHRTMEIAQACDIPEGSIFRVLTEALDVRNVGKGVWALKKAG